VLQDDGLVHVEHDGRTGFFDPGGCWLAGELRDADPQSGGRNTDPAPRRSALPQRLETKPELTQLSRVASTPPESRSPGRSYQQLLDSDSRAVPAILREQSFRDVGPLRVPIARYTRTRVPQHLPAPRPPASRE